MFRNINFTNSFNIRIIILIISIILILIIGYYAYKSYGKKNIYSPNRENGINMINEEDKYVELILFSTTWCPYCQKTKPHWDSITEKYKNKKVNGYYIQFINYDCTEESEEINKKMNEYNITGYPTIKLLKDNNIINFDANPTEDTLDEFINTFI